MLLHSEQNRMLLSFGAILEVYSRGEQGGRGFLGSVENSGEELATWWTSGEGAFGRCFID